MPETNRRKPRFARTQNPPNFTLTHRDIEIIRHITRYRFLRSTHVSALLAASQQVILRRLQLLFHHGYIDRPREQIAFSRLCGNQHMIYGPARKPAKGLFIEHTLAIADFMVAIECACRTEGVRFIDQDKIVPLSPRAKRGTGHPLSIGVIPDRLFAIEKTDEAGVIRTGYFFLEADRGTMPVVRSQKHQTSIAQKLRAYEAMWKQGSHVTHFGIPRFRVIITTTSEARAERIRTQCGRLGHGRGIFLVTAVAASIASPVFRRYDGKVERLLDGI